MQYKTIVLQFLEQHPEIKDQLQKQRQMLPTLELFALQLKTRHEAWKERLSQTKPGSDETQIASEAMEMALKDLEDRLPFGSPPNDQEPLSLDKAMVFVRRHTQPR